MQKTTLAFASMKDCSDSLNLKRPVSNRTALICASKDGDGLRPFQLSALSENGVQKIERTFMASLEECRNLVSNLRIDRGGTAVMCLSKDGDGIRPFVAGELNIETKTMRFGADTFNSKQECDSFIRQ
jgi:hypothetical protein